MSTPLMPALRTGAFGAVILFSCIVLALSAHVTYTSNLFGFYFTFAALGIATALLVLLTLPIMLLMDRVRKGAVTSMIIIELSWLGLLWVLWLSTAATASSATSIFFGSCSRRRAGPAKTACQEIRAIQAFAHLSWLILFGYLGTLLTFTIMAASRGYNRVWYQSVNETEFNAPPVAYGGQPVPVQTQQYIPPQNSGVPQGAYPQPAYPPQQGSPAPGWTGQPQQATMPPYPQAQA